MDQQVEMPSSFISRLRRFQHERRSVLCVGLDPELPRLPPRLVQQYGPVEALYHFCRTIVEATEPFACAYKLNMAFFEAAGSEGYRVLERLTREIRGRAIIIADAKRGDIGNTARMYAEALYDHLRVDACTVSPYMGRDSVLPFLESPDKAAFVLARTSNDGSQDFQHLSAEGEPLYRHVARRVDAWNEASRGQAGLVVGATAPEALRELRELCPTLPFLVPGVGAQGGDPRAVVEAARTPEGAIIVNSSRSVIYAASDERFAEAAATAAQQLARQLQPA